ncbi:type II secretion system protein [Solidesulfovibrio sp.]|jgi:prepilin-type N-terminal cleavage/methylation domain-containing protein|uniref:pilus assembly FimT family protein n=1 Tax=Solidesulfovibrio sp. TaxID=2910990 RepID=UPI002B1F5899|nr:type II secretion system protein [Solidesulfovibrio sp.]MEA4856797.1 type II secretion system protein [Solidesulfovibrio sp.]
MRTAKRRQWARRFPTAGRRFASGFTILEVVAVLLILGILAVVAVSSMGSGSKAVAEADALRSVLRYAQSRAMADVYTWGVAVSSSGYTLFSDNPSQTNPSLPTTGSNTHTVASGVTLSASGNNTIWYDWRGVPVSSSVNTPGSSGAAVATYQYINVTESGKVSTVTVTPYTGFVP